MPWTYVGHRFILSKPPTHDPKLGPDEWVGGWLYTRDDIAGVGIGWHIVGVQAAIIILLTGGTVFTLRAREKSLKARSRQIVVVDDEPRVLEMLERAIRDWLKDVHVLTFQDSDNAWQELSRTDPDFFITDCNLPGLECEQFFSSLAMRKVKYPILVLSESDEGFLKLKECLLRCPDLNVTFLRKPFTVERFNQELRAHIGPKTKA